VRVPGSTSNLGAGFDCVGLALDRYLIASYEPGAGPLEVERRGTLADLRASPRDDLLVQAFTGRLARAGLGEPTGRIVVDSEIPFARGLGSSAAAVVAGWVLAGAAAGLEFDRQGAFEEAAAREGHPDNAAPASLGGLIAIARDGDGAVRPFRLPLSPTLGFAYAAPGVVVATAAARAALPPSVPLAQAARGLGRVAALVHGLATADPAPLRAGFADELHVPHRLRLIPGGAAALAAAEGAGAWAATISGAGSGLIAVCPPERAEEVAAAMGEAFRREAGPDGVVHFAARPDPEGARLIEA